MKKESSHSKELEPTPHFTFVTTNSEKIRVAKRHLESTGIVFSTASLDIEELQSDDFNRIAIGKAEQAFQQLQRPVVISDHSWSIPALNGFPGPFMKYINQWFSTTDMQNLMAGHRDKTIIKTEVLCYHDMRGYKVFSFPITGVIIDQPRGNGLPVLNIASFREDGLSASECAELGIDIAQEYTVWEELAEWYKKNR